MALHSSLYLSLNHFLVTVLALYKHLRSSTSLVWNNLKVALHHS